MPLPEISQNQGKQMSDKYRELDEAIVRKISVSKASTFTSISGGDLQRLADALAGKDRYGWPRGSRIIERRLQALRKAGKLAYSRKEGWISLAAAQRFGTKGDSNG